ncbi:MAG: hypothetical protein NZ927_09780, partial [Candidatus Calescibacterium sp.]|nr:hypothetical protein [Candidatus Calescibacterium sp.]
FEIVKEFLKIFPGDYKPRVIEKDLEIYLPETYVFLSPPRPVFWYYQPKRLLLSSYEVPCDNDDIIFLFKELEREFIQFFEAFKEASIAH